MHVTLPSGAAVCVEEPRLRAVLISGGSEAALIEAVWAHDMDAERLLAEDRSFLLQWCVTELSFDDEAAGFAAICERYGTQPSARLRITDPVLAYECDCAFTASLEESRADAREKVRGKR